MKSIGKYDLLEPITTGSVEVFVAEEKGSGLRRLVYLGASKDNTAQLGTREILQIFRTLAPDPPGVILDAGKDPSSRSVYLVTSFPSDPLAVQTWMQAYRAFSEKEKKSGVVLATGLISLGEGAQLPQSEGAAPTTQGHARPPLAEHPGEENQQAGEFTRMFQQLTPAEGKTASVSKPLPLRDEAQTAQMPPVQASRRPESPSNPILNSTGQHSSQSSMQSPGEFTREFFSASSPEEQSSETAARAKTGEFTQFFRGGSSSPPGPPSPRSDIFPEPGDDPGPGEFTKMFSSSRQPAPAAPEPRFSTSPNLDRISLETSSGTFTRLMKSTPATPPATEPPQTGGFAAPKFDAAALDQNKLEPGPARAASTTFVPRPMWDREEEHGREFSPPPAPEPAESQPAAPAGPSEFTRVISARSAPPPSSELSPAAPSAPPAMSSAVAPASVTPPSITPPTITPPAVAMPQAPAAPQMPQLACQAPAAPQFSAPAQAPAPAPAPRPMSYLPLFIILNVLLIAGVALVLYFALKPH